jgi:hypothetical protein
VKDFKSSCGIGGVPICKLRISSAITRVRGESRPEADDRKKRSTGEGWDGVGAAKREYRSVIFTPRAYTAGRRDLMYTVGFFPFKVAEGQSHSL